MSDLTILLPLKGRPLFTLRFLWHATQARLPYKFVIADGEVDEEIARLINKSFQLDIDYIRFPDDVALSRCFLKMSLALERVTTPYVKMADNDDFLVASGLDYCTRFLDANPDYCAASGGIAGVSIRGDVRGTVNKWSLLYSPRDKADDFSSDNPAVRIIDGMRSTWSYYSVFRTEVLKTLWREVVEINPSHFGVAEKYMAARALALGKMKNEAGIYSYVRQYWTSLQLHWKNQEKDYAELESDLQRIGRRINTYTHPWNSASILSEWFADVLECEYGARSMLRKCIPQSLRNWLKRRLRPLAGLERKRLIEAGLPAHELKLIEKTLFGQQFMEFLNEVTGKGDSWSWRSCDYPGGQGYWGLLSGQPLHF